eukprot:scaffold1070_cov102-Isochrysis_galbana.AAC.1
MAAARNAFLLELMMIPYPPRPPPMPGTPPSPPTFCEDDCVVGRNDWTNDGICDDGGPGSEYDGCDWGADCSDCGVRMTQPPAPPSPPPFPQCDQCDAGVLCGICLELIPPNECPNVPGYNALPRCNAPYNASSWPGPGQLCRGFGECGTSTTDDNCLFQSAGGVFPSPPSKHRHPPPQHCGGAPESHARSRMAAGGQSSHDLLLSHTHTHTHTAPATAPVAGYPAAAPDPTHPLRFVAGS